MKFTVKCVKSGRAATSSTSIEGAERNASKEGFVKIDGKWYFKKEYASEKSSG